MRNRAIEAHAERQGPTLWLAAALLAAALLTLITQALHAAGAPPGSADGRRGPRVEILQPEYLSLQEGGVLTVRVSVPHAQRVPASFALLDPESGMRTELGSSVLSLHRGPNDIGVPVPSVALLRFVPGDTVTFVAWAGGRSAVMETTVRYGAATSALSSWAMAFPASPLVLSSSSDGHVDLTVTNPKRTEKHGRITLKFLDVSARTVGMASENVSLSPGSGNESVDVSRSAVAAAKTAGAKSVSATLKVGGAVRATASVPVVFDGASPLTASASASPLSGSAPLTVAFTGSASGGTGPYTYDWTFGDGSAHGTAQNPSHVYAAAGSYSASLTVKDALNATATSATLAIVVSSAPVPLAASASGSPLSGSAPLTVAFTGSASGGTGPYTYDWTFGDGSAHGTAQNPSHVYAAAGSYSASLTVKDALNATATSSALSITVTAGGGGPSLSAIQTSLFTPRCSGCHGGSNPRAGMNLSAGQSYGNLVNVVSTTNPPVLRVKPGDPANSFLVVQLAGGHMSVSASDQQTIRDWISAGAPNN